jgi:hypothetical protein
LIGAVFVGRFVPPFMDPSSTAAVIATKYAEHATGVRIGAIISAIGLSLIAPFGGALAAQTRPLVTGVERAALGDNVTTVDAGVGEQFIEGQEERVLGIAMAFGRPGRSTRCAVGTASVDLAAPADSTRSVTRGARSLHDLGGFGAVRGTR